MIYFTQQKNPMKKISVTKLSLVLVAGVLLFSCSKGDSGDDAPPTTPPATCSGTPGPLFNAVKSVIQANCESCHNNSIANGGMNWTSNCNIVANKTRIKVRAVDNNPTPMPPTGALAQADKDKITAWINAGGRLTD